MAANEPLVFEGEDETITAEKDGDRLILDREGETVRFEIDEPDAIPLVDEEVPAWCHSIIRKVGLNGVRRKEREA